MRVWEVGPSKNCVTLNAVNVGILGFFLKPVGVIGRYQVSLGYLGSLWLYIFCRELL